MFGMVDNTIPSELRLPLYLASRYLQELGIALRLAGIHTRYERPGEAEIVVPRLYVEHPEHGELSEAICATPLRLAGRGLEWWFEWRAFVRCVCPECVDRETERICRVGDMKEAARVVVGQLFEESG